jgi:hypothetical protein
MIRTVAACLFAATALAAPAAAITLIPGNLVVSVEGNGVWGAAANTKTYGDNQAAPLTLMQFSHVGTNSASYLNSLVLPTSGAGVISGEYGSSSEGTIQLTGDGKHLIMMGYGVNAAAFNANPTAYGTAINDPSKPTALGQSGSLTGKGYTPVARVVALIGGDGSVDTSTRLFNVFNGNNPRSAASVDGKTIYVSGQGVDDDKTAGVWVTQAGSSSATMVTGLDATKKAGDPLNETQDTRILGIHDGSLYVSTDTKGGKNSARDFIGTFGGLPTGTYQSGAGPTQLTGFGTTKTGDMQVTAANGNGIAPLSAIINLSPEQYYFANDTTLYVADSGAPKNTSGATAGTGLGGLQKWSFSNGSWNLDYTLSAGLNLVANSAQHGTTGLLGLTGRIVDGQVQLYATNYTVGDTDQTYLYGITDSLGATTKPIDEIFTQLAAAPADSNFKGVSFAPGTTSPAPEPATYAAMILGFGVVGGAIRRRRASGLAA